MKTWAIVVLLNVAASLMAQTPCPNNSPSNWSTEEGGVCSTNLPLDCPTSECYETLASRYIFCRSAVCTACVEIPIIYPPSDWVVVVQSWRGHCLVDVSGRCTCSDLEAAGDYYVAIVPYFKELSTCVKIEGVCQTERQCTPSHSGQEKCYIVSLSATLASLGLLCVTGIGSTRRYV